jgi:hypothetical protein
MKSIQLFVSLFIISVLPLHAQITITNSDMPSLGKKYFITHSYDFDSVKPALTGANYTWDFSKLTEATQEPDSIIAITSAPQLYQVVFNSYLEPVPTFCIYKTHLENYDSLSKYNPTEIYEYYKTDSAHFSYAGLGFKLQGFVVPVKYNTFDNLYSFPLSYGNSDSGASYFETPSSLSTVLYYASHQKRKNMADGWGTIKTPYGSFSALRIKSTINAIDTIYKTADSSGYKIQQPTRYEYKWLGQNSGFPLLQINTEISDSNEVITAILYQDTLRFNSIGKAHPKPINVRIYPNPFSQYATIEYGVDQYSFVSVELIDLNGKILSKLQSGYKNPGVYNLPLNIETNRSSVYFIKIRLNDKVHLEKITYTK